MENQKEYKNILIECFCGKWQAQKKQILFGRKLENTEEFTLPSKIKDLYKHAQ